MRFTVGIPAFKGKYFEECLKSVLNQSFIDYEVVIVDDASPDSLKEIVDKFQDDRIHYYCNNKNIGAEHVVLNWNKCLEKAKGEFFLLLGDDDVLERKFLEEFNNLILAYNHLDVFHCRTREIDEDSKVTCLTPAMPEYESVFDNIWHRIKGYRIQFISDFVFRTSALVDNGGFFIAPLAWASDDITVYQICGSKGIAHTNKILFNYRRNSSTISSTGPVKLKLKAIDIEKNWIEDFLKKDMADEDDRLLKKCILDYLPTHINKKRLYTISKIYEKGPWGGLKWLITNKKSLNIKWKELIISYAINRKDKFITKI